MWKKKSQRDRKFEVFFRERENFEEIFFIFEGNFDKKNGRDFKRIYL